MGIARHMCSSKTEGGDSDAPRTSNGTDKLDLAKPRARQRAEKAQAAAETKYVAFIIPHPFPLLYGVNDSTCMYATFLDFSFPNNGRHYHARV